MTDVTTLVYTRDETTLEYVVEATTIEAAGIGPPGASGEGGGASEEYVDNQVAAVTGSLDSHANDTTDVHGIPDTSLLETTTHKGTANGYAELDSSGLVPSAQLPSFVDDVIEAANFAALPGTGATGKIYVTLDDNKTFRWSGSAYVEISASLALGETSSTAYRGDRGKTAYDHSQTTSGNPHNVSKSDVGLGSVTNDAQLKIASNLSDLNNAATARANLAVLPATGWIPEASLPTYSSGSNTNTRVYTATTDATTRMSVGWKVRFTDTTVKYGIITALTATSITVYMGTDYVYTSTSNPTTFDVSPVKAPLGFPMDPTKWTVLYESSASQLVTLTGTPQWLGDTEIVVPIGTWHLEWEAILQITSSAAGTSNVRVSLSTSKTSVSDARLQSINVFAAAVSGLLNLVPGGRSKTITVASVTSYYLNAYSNIGTTGSSGVRGDLATTMIQARCPYL